MVAEFKIVSATPEGPATPSPDVVELSLAGLEAKQGSVEVVSKDVTLDAQVRAIRRRQRSEDVFVTLQRASQGGIAGR